ncbi:hypothetical protein PHISP_01581 [Aspergillus sp. HF37]|nr:hypothetical protein PHISP_01581 [Aspergillus sp. HF37]
MARLGFLSLALLSLQAFIGCGLAEAPKHIAVSAHASFPESEIFGVKIVNGEPAHALVTFTNEESSPIAVNFIGGALWDLDEERSQNVRNLTTSRYSMEIPAGQKESLSYTFATEMHPQDLRLQLSSIVTAEDNMYNIVAYNSTVSVVEPETSILDPQVIFLYFFLLACFGGVVYFFYTVWIAPYFPQKRRAGKGAEVKKSGASEKVDSPADGASNVAASSATTYNAEWIPAHHISRPEQKKVKGRATKSRV